jgi:uncharacterized membrane protein
MNMILDDKLLFDILLISVVVLVLDFIYLSLFSVFFGNMIRNIQGDKMTIKLLYAVLCYMVIIFGVYYFIVRKNETVLNAMLLGWFIYYVYELTNMATIKKWSYVSVLIDGTWGGILFGLSTMIIYYFKSMKIKYY